MSPEEFGPHYYAASAGRFGWDADHVPNLFKLEFLQRHVSGDVVLDLACGPGVYASSLARRGRRVIGMDFSRELLRRRAKGDWLAAAASALAVPLRDRSVDCACLLSVLEHVDDVAMLRETIRVTRARIIIQVPLSEPSVMTDAGVLFSHWSDRSHLRTYTEASLRTLVTGAGWRMTSFVPAYHRDLQELFVRGLAAPEFVRNAVRAMLKPIRSLGARPAAEAFAIAEPA